MEGDLICSLPSPLVPWHCEHTVWKITAPSFEVVVLISGSAACETQATRLKHKVRLKERAGEQ